MNVRPEFVDLETGEVSDGRTPLQIARSELAAFKFKLIETVAADPRLSKAPCVAAIVVFLSFVTIDKKTLKPTPAFASKITMMVRGGMKETMAKLARKLLAENGYLVPTGGNTKDGCVKYQVANPHEERVAFHVNEATEYLKERAAEERKEERRRKQQAADVGSEYDPTQSARGVATQPDVGSEYDPNYLRRNLEGGSEEKDLSQASSAPSVYGQDDDPHLPYPVPESADELERMLDEIIAGARFLPAVLGYFRVALAAGKLTPAMVDEQRRLAS